MRSRDTHVMSPRARRCLAGVALTLAALALAPSAARAATNWDLDLVVNNAGTAQQTVTIGADTLATDGIDTALGEQPLPPPPPSTVFDVRLILPGGEASLLDLRPANDELRQHTLKWQAGAAGYPVTITWSATQLPPGTFTIADAAGGVFLGPFDMREVEQVTVGPELYFLTSLRITVQTAAAVNEPPSWVAIPHAEVFVGQRLPILDLHSFASDVEDPASALGFDVFGPGSIQGSIIDEQYLELVYPVGWTGTDSVMVTVHDQSGASAETWVHCQVRLPIVLPDWRFRIATRSATGLNTELVVGLAGGATLGLDPEYGEVELPPPPPDGTFDARLQPPGGGFESETDIRSDANTTVDYLVRIQPDSDGWPLELAWEHADVPPGTWMLTPIDAPGLAVDPWEIENISLGPEAGTGNVVTLLLAGTHLHDTTGPVGLALLEFHAQPGQPFQTVEWTAASDVNFDFYDLQLLDEAGDQVARYDRWNASSLTDSATTSFQAPWPADTRSVRLIAWDRFGNSSVGNLEVSSVDEIPHARDSRLTAYPNPFNPRVTFEIDSTSLNAGLVIYDLAGRAIRRLSAESREGDLLRFVWNGCDASGRRVASATYVAVLQQKSQTQTCKVQMLK